MSSDNYLQKPSLLDNFQCLLPQPQLVYEMGREKICNSPSQLSTLCVALLSALAIPSALLMWFGNIMMLNISSEGEENEPVPPTRWLAAVLIPLIISIFALQKKSVNQSGAVFGSVVGFILTLSSYCFLADLLTFFIVGSKATKFKNEKKKQIEYDFKEGGQRNWVQVLCNGGMATVLALLYIIDCGCGEVSVNFTKHYRASWLSIGVLGSLACAFGDTLASELGVTLNSDPVLITTFKKVPKGTNGGITIGGLVFSFLGGLILGVAHYLTVIYYVDNNTLYLGPAQWPIILTGGLAGLFGSIVDSLLGATLQYSGLDKNSGCIVERHGKEVKHISGAQLLDNHSVNLVSTVLMGYLTPLCAKIFW